MDNKKKVLREIFQDITDWKKTESELISAKEKAEESDRLKTAFLHNISHEIRTPLNAIVGFSSLLGEPDADDIKRQSYVDIIMQSSNKLLAILSDIIEISNIEANIVKKTIHEGDINKILNSLYDKYLTQTHKKGIKFNCKTELSISEAQVFTDITKLTQILSNLTSNAIKFTDEGSISINCRQSDNFLEFNVSDTGIGIASEFHQNVFDRFFQIQNSETGQNEGTGLGLPISRAYVEILGGNIWLKSDPGEGTVFSFTIPYEKRFDQEMVKNEDIDKSVITFPAKKRILVAEDVESNFKLIKYFLSGFNAEILWARNGKEAVEKCRSDRFIDLVLLDIKMPVMDGYSAARLIRESNSSLPIIAQTAYFDDKDKAIECGCNGFLSKPFDKNNLQSIILEYLHIQ